MSDALAEAVVLRLKGVLPAFACEYFPDAPGRYPFANKDRTLLVAPEDSSFGEPESLFPMSVTESVLVSVTVLVRSLRGPGGASTTCEDVRKALFGWRPVRRIVGPPDTFELIGFGPLVPVQKRFVGEDNGTWRFAISFRAPIVVVADDTDPNLLGPLFKEPIFIEGP